MALKILVCGIHRSGNSLVAHHLARALSLSLLDDPEWAKSRRIFDEFFFQDEKIVGDLNRHEILKIPRFVLSLNVIMPIIGDDAMVISVVRNPFDVYASFLDSLRNGTLETASMVTVQGDGSDFLREFQEFYSNCLLEACQSAGSHTRLINFEDLRANAARLGSSIRKRDYVGPPENRRKEGNQYGLRMIDRTLAPSVFRELSLGKAGAAYRKVKVRTTAYRNVLEEFRRRLK